jgi:hypothetical protein
MTTSLLAATAAAAPDPTVVTTLVVLGVLAWRLALILLFPFAPCRSCHGAGRHRRGKYWRPCRRCGGTGRKVRLGRRVWNWTRSHT